MEADAEITLLAIAATQLGLFTLQQATDAGVTREMLRGRLRRRVWRRVYRTVFIIEGHPTTPASVHLASVLACGESARSSHRAGAWLWNMTAHEQKPEVSVVGHHPRIRDVRIHRTLTLLETPVIRQGVPVTSAAETLLDLGAVKELRDVQAALDRAIANRVVTPVAALAELNRPGKIGVRGTTALRQLLDTAGITGSHHPSVLEAKMRRLIQRAGLPQPDCELVVGKHGEYRLDFCWPELQLVIEVDGWLYHASTAAFTRNKTRKNRLTVAGYSIIEYTWVHVTKTPAAVVREIQDAYAARTRLFVP